MLIMNNKLTAICDPYLRFTKLIGEMTDTYLDMVKTYFEDYIASDASKARTLLGNLSIDIYDKITSVCSKAQLKDYKKCNFLDDSRIKEKLITSTLNDHIRWKLNKHKDWTVEEMMKLGVELDGSNIKPDVSDTNYVDNDKKLDKNKKISNSNIDKILQKENNFNCNGRNTRRENFDFKKRNYNDFRPNDNASRNYQNNNFRDSVGNSRNFRNNQSSNNNSNYNGRNSMWHNNNNANNYDRNNAWQNNNNFGRNISWSYNNQRNQNQDDDRNGNRYESYNYNNNSDGGNNT
ncbi:probable ATP-dependent RNA helicase ddx42 [Gordionus sp. m RMFG-2023]|uniref:probable ATP-dependent RNA helicase ddx42 n=1 Tax=Gordionus sp. m RMFG-2023 TaxID=3053472 RepID=UPI0031FCF57F